MITLTRGWAAAVDTMRVLRHCVRWRTTHIPGSCTRGWEALLRRGRKHGFGWRDRLALFLRMKPNTWS